MAKNAKVAPAEPKVKKSGRVPRFQDGARPGDTLTKMHGETKVVVKVLADGFHYNGNRYTSLSKIGGEITGCSTNGPLFFGLRAAPEKPAATPKAKPAKKAKPAAAPAAA